MDVESEMKTEELLGDELCRLCANTDKQMIPIFQGEGIEHNIPEQIETYLPIITVTQTDELPLNICYQCTSTLIAWHNFFEQCRSADNRLREILSVNIKFNEDDETYHDYTDDFHNDLDDQALVTDDAQVDCVLIEPKVSHVPISACSNESILPISDEQILPVSDRQISPVNDRQISPVSDKPIPTVSDAQISTLDAPIMETSDNDSVSKDESKSVIETVNDSRRYEDLGDVEDYGILIDELDVADEMPDPIENCELDRLNRLKDCAEYHLESETKPSSPVLLVRVVPTEFLAKRAQRRSAQVCAALDGGQPLRVGDGKFQCPRCDKKFRRKLNVQQHLLTHVCEKNVKCEHCSFFCYTKSQLDVHQKKHAKRYGCDLCAKMFAYKFQLDTHVQAVHYNMRPYPCAICGKSFKTRYNYGSHMAQHRDVRNFQCPHCPHKCRKSYDLRVHIRTHTGEKPFQCSYCERCYSQNSDRLKHERICLPKMTRQAAPALVQDIDSAKDARTKNRTRKLS